MTSFDLFGVGIGPFNLSLAALADTVPGLRCRFMERRARFAWHPGLMIPGATMQTSFLKDLVTPVLPTSRWSFLNYLVTHGRFFDFMAGRNACASRAEFADYMGWVAHGLDSTGFGDPVETVDHDGQEFVIQGASGQRWRSRAVSVGVGMQPDIPGFAAPGPDCLHASRWLERPLRLAGRRIAVIGGGQSGAEIVLDLLSRSDGPAQIIWISRRPGFWTLQEGAFIDQFFTPGYVMAWRGQSPSAREAVLAGQKYASDGITPATADAIHDALYQRRREGRGDTVLRPGREVHAIRRTARGQVIEAQVAGTDRPERCEADLVVLATGYRPAVPDCLEPLAARLHRQSDGGLALDAHFRVIWDGPRQTPLYAMNHGRHSHGIADPQISLAAWRSAVMLNDLTGQLPFPALAERADSPMVDWPGREGKEGTRGDDKIATAMAGSPMPLANRRLSY
ncbi:lysine N(6)-hydroxylase/L-ornithine N(5)-oxygenase family protein [Paracoccus sp. (in: a-proteobacteria)]|uniref:lysine N(6)-hydroxylase/L-ornithine N(5)-oxygenase family protein n=1 Tax=Paracoccus sp. TaxID=267 RepID=UPI003A8B306F